MRCAADCSLSCIQRVRGLSRQGTWPGLAPAPSPARETGLPACLSASSTLPRVLYEVARDLANWASEGWPKFSGSCSMGMHHMSIYELISELMLPLVRVRVIASCMQPGMEP